MLFVLVNGWQPMCFNSVISKNKMVLLVITKVNILILTLVITNKTILFFDITELKHIGCHPFTNTNNIT